MKVQYASDLHLEFNMNSLHLAKNPLLIKGEVLLLAGDITYFNDEFFKDEFFDYVSKNFNEVLIVPGNHEYYYGFNLANHNKPFKKSIRFNVHYCNNLVQTIDGVDFILTTLWSRLDRMFIPFIVNGMNDFYKITYKDDTLNATQYNRINEHSIAFLNEAFKTSKSKKRVVVTHHVPTHLCNPSKYVGNLLNSAFVNSLGDMIETNNIDYWVYGHHHNNLGQVELGKTRIVTNQLGYVQLGECVDFDLGAYFEV
ncbi:MAG: metallophosphoesterase [Salinivirgaceae bacterium]|jgi:predicted phosphohydrolase